MTARSALVALAVLGAVLAGCIAPADVPGAGTRPAGGADVALPETIAGLEPLASLALDGANDLVFRGGLAFVSAGSGTHVVDVSDPAVPVLVASVECKGKDIGVVDLADGRRVLTVSWQADDGCPDSAPKGGIRLVDVTDPAAPVVLKQVPLAYGSHTNTPYGDTGLVYNSAYDLANPLAHHRAEILDVSDPENATVVGEFMFPATSLSHGCHDVLAEPERNRAVCAGITETMIWDTTDPLAPRVVSTIRNPLINIHHSAVTARDGTLLILGDEFGGAAGPGCVTDGVAPTGALWFYDVSDPANPRMLGHFAPPAGAAAVPCTAHNFNVVADRDLVVGGFYTAGTLLVDFTDPAKPVQVAQVMPEGTVAWASYYHAGHVFVGDSGRGLDVLAFA